VKYIFMAGFFIIVGSLYALSGAFAGLGMEVNANTRDGAAFGGGLSAGLDINQQFSFGIKTAVSSSPDAITSLETAGFFRYYLPFKFNGLFAQAELGAAILFEDGKNYPAFLGGAAFGWRYDFNKNWHIEPYVRCGYPFIWGAGFHAGYHFDFK
jgi:hypothetical protein